VRHSSLNIQCVSEKVPTFKLSVTLSNVNNTDFQNFYTAETQKRRKFATKLYDTTHLTLGMLLQYLRKLKIQIFCRYSVDMEENATNCICALILIRLCV